MLLNVRLDIAREEFITIYGNSGAGKTSLLRILAGLLSPETGRITAGGTAWFDGKVWFDTDKKINLSPRKRKTGFVTQDPALFPNMSVKENLVFALSKGQGKKVIGELLEIMELGELLHLKPNLLSGGQKQRVALARALVSKPDLLLLDEPLSALDAEMRNKLQDYILQVHREYRLTTILVSHDRAEILKLSGRLLILEKGTIIRSGRPQSILTTQKDTFCTCQCHW